MSNTPTIDSYTTGHLIKVVVTSFGYLHGDPPGADITLDLRKVIRDPHCSPEFRQLTGLEPEVRDHVWATPGSADLTRTLTALVFAFISARDDGCLTRVAIGCAGGRHRSVVVANDLAYGLLQQGIGTDVSHRDILKPVQGTRK